MVISPVLALLALAVLGAIYLYQHFGEMLKYAGKLPGPPAYPIIGNGLLFLNKSPAEFLRIVTDLLKEYGDCIRVWLGTQLSIVVLDPKDIEVLLSSPKYIDKSTEYDFIRPWLGEGLLTSQSAMGTKVNAQINSTSNYVLAVKEITNLIQLRFYDFLIRYDIFFRLSANSRKQKKMLKILHSYTDSVIKERRQQLEAKARNEELDEASDQDLGIKKRMAFLDMLLQTTIDGRPLTDLEIREEVDTDARYFPDPERFDPERFNVERSAEKANPYQYIPFSAGPRNCIGQKFAVAELKSIVSKVLRHYEILLPAEKQDESFIAELILRPEHGVFGIYLVSFLSTKSASSDKNPTGLGRVRSLEQIDVLVGTLASISLELNTYQPFLDMFVATLTFVALAISVALYVYVEKFSKILKHSGKLGGPTAYPLIGNGLIFAGQTPAGFLQTVGRLIQQYGRCFRVWLGTQMLIVITEPKDIEVLLSSNKYIDKSIEYDFIRPWLGEGLLTSTGRKWHTHRKVITPTFHFKILEQFVEIFDQQSNTFVQVLGAHAKSGNTFDIFRPVTLCALDVICETAMGTKVNAQLNTESEYVQAVKDITNLVQIRLFNFLIRYELFYRFSSNRRKQLKALKVLHGYTDSVIKSRRKELQAGDTKTVDNNENDLGIKKKMAFLDMLLQSTIDGKPLTD
uniref:Cytochrome P450 n=1 Tax=Anopheles culicifacies TaxID=139723 RepID=A0A182MM45_9DIPT